MSDLDVFDSELCATVLTDESGVITGVGAGWAKIIGWPAVELVGNRWSDLCQEAHRARFERVFTRLEHGADVSVVHARFSRPDRPSRLRFRFGRRADGGFLAVVEDLSERATTITTGSEMQTLVDVAFEAWFVHDLEGRVIDANRWAHESLGYTREEMLGMHVADFETTVKPGRFDGVWSRMDVGVPVMVEGRQRRKDGSEFPVEVRLVLFEREDGELVMHAVCNDISARKAAEEEAQKLHLEVERTNAELTALNATLEELVRERTETLATTLNERQAILDNVAAGLVAVDSSGRVRTSNPMFALLTGVGDVDGQSLDVLPAAVASLIRDALEDGESISRDLDLPGGRFAKAIATPIDEPGGRGGAVALIRDVTFEKEVDRMKTEFIATVSHELRTPLTSVLGFTRLISNKLESRVLGYVPDDDARAVRAVEQVRSNLQIVMREGERLTTLINDLLDISKMEAGHMEWHFETVDVSEVVEATVASATSLFEGRPVDLRVDIQAGIQSVHADRGRLQQVLLNLLSNASKFTDEGHVEVAVREVEDGVEFRVTDTGEGIPVEEQTAVFERFRQIGDTMTNRPKGTGLGLSICREIIAAHEGEIWVESVHGEGTTFAFVLPTVGMEERVETPGFEALLRRLERHVKSGTPSSEGATVLVVDDDSALREMLRQTLEEAGYKVREAADGWAAIDTIRESRPDLVILDVNMPKLSGFDVAALLKSDPETESIPIIILSIINELERGLKLGVDRYLSKPVNPDELYGAIEDLLHQGASPRRVLVVDDGRTTSSDISRLLESKGYHVVGTCTGEECLDEARRSTPDLILVESLVSNHPELVRTIRWEKDLEHVLVVQYVEE